MFSSTRKLAPRVSLGIALLFIGSNGWAFPGLLTNFNNTYSTTGTRLDTCGTCHFDFDGGGALNPYGANSAEGSDPDGDQATSIVEIGMLMMPGYDCNNYIQALNAPADLATYVDAANPGCLVAAPAASILPASRSVQVGNTATAFATMINPATATATSCGITPVTSVPASFSYQTTDPATNALTGTPDTPVDIVAGGVQSFVFAFTPTATIPSTDVELAFDCANSDPAPVTIGLNTLLLSASTNPVSDIVALAATPTGDGIVNLPGDTGANAFAVATVNVGSQGTITAAADTGSATLPVVLFICETNATTGACLSPPTSSVTTTIAAGATPTFSVFVTGTGAVAFDPANNRIFLRFRNANGATRGSTSVAVRTL